MSDLMMTKSQREAFLADLHVGVIGIDRVDAPPLAAPVWYSYEPGGDVVFVFEADSEKLARARCDVVFAPDEREMYPGPQEIVLSPPRASLTLEAHEPSRLALTHPSFSNPASAPIARLTVALSAKQTWST